MPEMQRELDRIYERMDRGFVDLNERLDALNGRTRVNETDIAVLKDRSSSGVAAACGGGVAGAIVAAVEAMRLLWLK